MALPQVRRAHSGFHKRPLQLQVDQPRGVSEVRFAARGDDTGNEPAITGQLFGAMEASDVADFQGDHRPENLTHTRHGLEPLHEALG